jgi:hypothetical protein
MDGRVRRFIGSHGSIASFRVGACRPLFRLFNRVVRVAWLRATGLEHRIGNSLSHRMTYSGLVE